MSGNMDVDAGDTSSNVPESDVGAPVSDIQSENGENLMDTLQNDYRAIPELDTYEQTGLDDETYSPQDIQDRRAAERELDARDAVNRPQAQHGWAGPQALMEGDEEAALQLRRGGFQGVGGQGDPDRDGGHPINLENFSGPLKDWIETELVQREIKKRFRTFLCDFLSENGENVYPQRINKMCRENGCSLEISYLHLSKECPVLAIWAADCPVRILEYFDETATEVVKHEFPNYHKIHKTIHVRISELPLLDDLRDLRKVHLNQLIKTSGVVTRRTNIFPQLVAVKFDCVNCGYLIGPIGQNGSKEVYPQDCPDCQSKGPFKVNVKQTMYRNYQKITIQESPGSVPAGRIPRSREVILTADLCDSVRPGEEIHVTGVYCNQYDTALNVAQGFPVFSTVIVANFISKKGDIYDKYNITDDEKEEIRKLSEDPDIERKLINSIAPSIWGHKYIKQALCYALFGGCEKIGSGSNKHRVRGDINILIMGDPGCGKSQFLKWTEKVAFRAVYATGKGASGVGLTASVRKDPLTREWTLEGGALVLADRGVCMIDEFDKMNDADRTSIHEAMEQQSISVSKAGIVTSLQARCAVIAAANPIKGRYDCSMSFVENVDLTDPILSRFDVLWVVRDVVDAQNDERLADFVVGNHIKSHPNIQGQAEEAEVPQVEEDKIDQDLLRKYIMVAKKTIKPKLHTIDKQKISSFYAELRQKSMEGGGIPIAVRHIESILRLSEARAKLHMRDCVRNDDVDSAIRMVLKSFIKSQKLSVRTNLERQFRKYLDFQRDDIELLMTELNRLVQDRLYFRGSERLEDDVQVDLKQFEAKANQLRIHSLDSFFKSDNFQKNGFRVEDRKIIKAMS